MKELLEGLYSYENNEYGFKVKNISKKERIELYKKIAKLREQNNFDDDEFTFEMFKELIECSGEIDFKEIGFEDFKEVLNSENTNEVFEELCFYIGMCVSRVIKTGLREQQEKVEKQELELMNIYLRLTMDNCIDLTRNIERSQLAKKKIKKQISKIKNSDIEEIERLVKNIGRSEEHGLQ